MKRLWLGLLLIAATSGVLLLSDWDQRLAKMGETAQVAAGSAKAHIPVGARLPKTWRLQLIELNNVLDVEEAEQGILDGLKEAELVRDRDYTINVRNAQGDMATVNSLVDAALAEGADLLLTLSTPTLQAAMQRAQGRVPIVFTYVASALAAGAGKSNEDHLPNVTGVPMVGAYGDMLKLIKRTMGTVRRLGTLYVPAEVNMVFNKNELTKAAAKEGIEVVAVGVATSSEVPDAALALIGRNIDALCQIPGNLTASAFGGIAQAATRAHVPVFAFQQVQAHEGAAVVMARDFNDAGREAARMAARIMRGEDPASIPFRPFVRTKLLINAGAAQAVGLTIPLELFSEADEVIRD